MTAAIKPATLAVPWWLWPNVLALDAPAVAVVWQRFLGQAFGVAIPAAASVTLALTVWGIYLADRWWDARSGATHQPRHRFAAEHPNLIVVAVGALLAAAGFALTLPTAYLVAGGALAALVAGYFGLVHLLRPNAVTARGGKEMLVGLLFAAGVAVPLVAGSHDVVRWLPAVAGFGVLCWLNCHVIDQGEEFSPGVGTHAPALGCAVMLFAFLTPLPVMLSLAMATMMLLMTHLVYHGIGRQLARVLADLVLLTPLVAWYFL